MKLTALLLGINAKFIHSTLSLYYLKQIISSYNNYNVSILETTINNQLQETINSIIAIKPDICCIAVYIWNAQYIKSLLPLLHTRLPQCKIILGGPQVSYTSNDWLKQFPFIDCIIYGAGEKSFEYLANHQFSTHEKIVRHPNYHFNDIPFPYTSEDLKNLANHYIYYESSRGCPYSCSYCISSREDQKLQFKDIQKVYDELDVLLQHKVRMVKFVDRTFNCNPTHSRALFIYLLDHNNYHTRFHFEIHPDLLFDEDFEILKQVPPQYFQFEIGIQSIHENTLHAIQRKMNREKARENIRKLVDLQNIHIHLDMICGLPYEDMEGVKESFNAILSLQPHYFQVGFLKILPGTDIDTKKHEYGIEHEDHPPYMVIKNKWISQEEMQLLHHIERVVDSLYNHHFKTTSLMLANFIAKDNLFTIYNEIANFFQQHGFALYAKSWESIAAVLLEFIKQHYPEHTRLATDCLRWDWFVKSNNKWVPPFIRSSGNPNTIKEMIIQQNRISKQELSLNNKIIPISELQRSQIFIGESNHFMQWRMDNHRYAVKLNGQILLID
ncbi:MAG: DUF4080 domain-containing protein [Spirochaetota bacterium]